MKFLSNCTLLLLVFFSNYSFAHDARPLYIELEAKSYTQILLKWKTPPIVELGNEPYIILSGDNCLITKILKQDRLQGAIIYKCDNINDNLVIDITYPLHNPALTSLISYTPLQGDIIEHFNDPSIQRVEVDKVLNGKDISKEYIVSGIKHILEGFDHLLFILCLFIITGWGKRLILAISGFTAGHTLTLIASSYQWISLPIGFVEFLIALSVLFLSVEITKNNKKTFSWKHPFTIASLFGLLHGFGFASVLNQYGLPTENKFNALVSFNLGVEIGQLLFISAVSLLMYMINSKFTFFKRGFNLGVYAIGGLSGYWVIERFWLLI
ncbi:HupE/UreJ family protein [Colwellia demingiae]|nr:HupE/UreJ family protein [Colwellia demingiae]